MYLAKSPSIIKKYYPRLVWDIPNKENKIYLTFDDGPTLEITQWVLNLLEQHHIKATFFCLGCNIKKHPEIYTKIKAEGHVLGNHTYHHLNGWHTSDEDYFRNIEKCNSINPSTLFRPPYGRIKKNQIAKIVEDYKIIMWDVISGDFDSKTTPEKCYNNVINNCVLGSVLVFHDSVKAFNNLKYVLPKAIEYLLAQGYVFDVIK